MPWSSFLLSYGMLLLAAGCALADTELPLDLGALIGPKRPNFLVILTDDQDQLLNSTHMAYMPYLNSLMTRQGMTLRNFVVSTATCCPTRTSLLTGLFTHNHNVTSNQPPHGSFSKFLSGRPDRNGFWLPKKLQDDGYQTFFVGKFLNGFTADPNTGVPAGSCPVGFDVLDALTEPYVYTYNGPAYSYNCGPSYKYDSSEYSTDIIRDKAIQYLWQAYSSEKPFYMQLNPIAPHGACTGVEGQEKSCSFPVPAARHANWFPNATIPKSDNWLKPLPPDMQANLWGDAKIVLDPAKLNARYQARLRSLAAVDELLRDVVAELEKQGRLQDTYIVYMSDNGFHMGHHGANIGKLMPWEEDVRVPFVIRGPGIPISSVTDYQATVVDLPATVLTLAGIPLPTSWDGYPIPFHRLNPAYVPSLGALSFDQAVPGQAPGSTFFRESVPIEMWIDKQGSSAKSEDNYRTVRVCTSFLAFGSSSEYRSAMVRMGTAGKPGATLGVGSLLYRAVRTAAAGDMLGTNLAGAAVAATGVPTGTCYKYTIWCWGARELYDLGRDPYEMNNLYEDPRAVRLLQRLDALLSVMSYCKGDRCRDAYSAAVKQGGVTSFAQLMGWQYDTIFSKLPKFSFRTCSSFYQTSNENSWYKGG